MVGRDDRYQLCAWLYCSISGRAEETRGSFEGEEFYELEPLSMYLPTDP